jgi:hypothetical protein
MSATDSPPLQALRVMVLKRGVMLGGLNHEQRMLALALAARCAPADAPGFSETQANDALKRCLVEECAFLDTDHVELRRWLVDTGWWQRDGFGRQYQRCGAWAAGTEHAALEAALAGVSNPAHWVQCLRDTEAAQRAARRVAWQNSASADAGT